MPSDQSGHLHRTPNSYRPDIDGLRAIAVLSVVIYHFDKRWLPGGYVGVDIFFVISGFLITQIIRKGMQRGDFSFAEFYLRRIRRIAPAFSVVTATTLLAGALLLLPEDLLRLSNSAIWSSLSAANIYFWRYLDTGYFAQSSDEQPLLHMWSLGVEEQFYLLWPAALFAVAWLFRRRSGAVAAALALSVCVASFAFGEVVAASHPKFAYFMLPARAGELMIGALLTWLRFSEEARRPGGSRIVADLCGFAGLALIAFSLVHLDDTSTFPGVNALYPCVGAALILLAGGRPGLVRSVLGLRPLALIGLISYSLYLWHWPILAFVRYFYGTVAPAAAALAAVSMLVLSILSYRFVERPARRMRGPRWKQVLLLFALPTCVLLAASFTMSSTQGLKQWIESASRNGQTLSRLRDDTRPAFAYDYNCQLAAFDATILAQPRCVSGENAKPRILLWGDSHAAHYVGVVGTVAKAAGLSYRNASHSACPPIFGGVYGNGLYRVGCDAFRPMIERAIERHDYDLVLMGANWSAYDKLPAFRGDLTATVHAIAAAGTKVVLLAEAPKFPEYRRECDLRRLRIGQRACSRATSPAEDSDVDGFLRSLAERSEQVSFLDIRPALCRNGVCSPYLNGNAAYYDTGHFSMAGSWRVGEALMALPAGTDWKTALSGQHIVMTSIDADGATVSTAKQRNATFVPTLLATPLPDGVKLEFPYHRLFENSGRRPGEDPLRILVEYLDTDPATVERQLTHSFAARGLGLIRRHAENGRIVLEYGKSGRTRATATIDEGRLPNSQAPGALGRVHVAWSAQ